VTGNHFSAGVVNGDDVDGRLSMDEHVHPRYACQLETRTWYITDDNGAVETVNGPGVVGKHSSLSSRISICERQLLKTLIATSGCHNYTMITDYLPDQKNWLFLKLSLMHRLCPKSARASPQQCANSAPDYIQIGSLSAELQPSTSTPFFCPVELFHDSSKAMLCFGRIIMAREIPFAAIPKFCKN